MLKISVFVNKLIFFLYIVDMKKLILFTLITLLINPLFSQTWQTGSGGDDFDGNYKIASIKGVGEEFPYNDPAMSFIKWDNQEDYSFYISDAKFLQPNTDIEIILVFDNEPGVFYSVYESTDGKLSLSSDGKTAFLNGFRNSKDRVSYSKYEILQKLMTASTVSVRFKDRFGQNDTKFSLSGSTKAINFVIPQNEITILIDKAIEVRNEEANAEQAKIELLGSLLEEMKLISLSDESLERLETEIKRDLGINWYLNKSYSEDIVSIKYEADFESDSFNDDLQVDLFYILNDGTKEEIYSTITKWILNSDSIIFTEAVKFKEEKLAATEAAIENVKNILNKYVIQDIKDEIFMEVVTKVETWTNSYANSWGWLDIKDIKAIFDKSGVITLNSITIYLKDGRENEYSIYSASVIKNRDFKQIGATLGELY